jgi:hypothetical protein
MASKPSRTTKKARSILRNDTVHLAVPGERLLPAGSVEPDTSLANRVRRTASSGSADAFVLAFLDGETAVLSTKASNPGLPDRLIGRAGGTPHVLEDSDHGLTLTLDDVDYRVSSIHAAAVRTLLASRPEPAEPVEPDTTEPDTAGPDAVEPMLPSDAQTEPATADSDDTADTEAATTNAEPADELHNDVDDPSPTSTPAVSKADPIPVLDADYEPQGLVESQDDWNDGPQVPVNKTTTWAKRLRPDADILYAVPAHAEQPVLSKEERAKQRTLRYWWRPQLALARRSIEADAESVVVAFDPLGAIVFAANRRNRARPDRVVLELRADGGLESFLTPIDEHSGRLTVGDRTFIVDRLYLRNLGAFLQLDDRTAGMAPLKNAWTEVVREFEQQMRLPPELVGTVEKRSRSTMQCQRLLKGNWVALATPAHALAHEASGQSEGNRVVAFTDVGPMLFSASRGNPGLPGDLIGPIDDASPISFGPHDREGGVLSFNGREFLVPHAYADSVRNLIHQMSQS